MCIISIHGKKSHANLTFLDRLVFEDEFILVTLGVGQLILTFPDNQLDVVDELERFPSIQVKYLVDLQDIAFVVVYTPLH